MAKILGERLRRYRSLKRLTLRNVKKKTGISDGYLNQLEQGRVKEPSPHILYKLAQCYEVPYEHLLDLAGYFVPAGQNSMKKVRGVAYSLLGDLTKDEEEELLRYLEFIRERKREKTRK